MSTLTKISPYRQGEMRFGPKDNGPVNSEVVAYQLSPEELEEYRSKGRFKRMQIKKENSTKSKKQGSRREVEELIKAHQEEVQMVKSKLDEKESENKGLHHQNELLSKQIFELNEKLDQNSMQNQQVVDLRKSIEQLQEENSELRRGIYSLRDAMKVLL